MQEFIPSLERKLYNYMKRANYRPMKHTELIRSLRIEHSKRTQVREALKSLSDKGKIVRLRKNRWGLPDSRQTVTGIISIHPDGFGFVTSKESDVDIFIPRRWTGTALHSDEVQVVISSSKKVQSLKNNRRKRRGGEAAKGPKGRVIQVINRRLTRVSGILKTTAFHQYVIPDDPCIPHNIHVQRILPEAQTPREGHCVLLELLPWTDPDMALAGNLIEDLGPADDPGVAIRALLRTRDLSEDFPAQVSRRAQSVRQCVEADGAAPRHDLRDQFLFTIDPEDAKDFDDAVSLRRLPNDRWELSVHIADVASYVQLGDDVDREAELRGNSVYLVDRVLAMLPGDLTTNICSLLPDTDRFAHTAQMTLSSQGDLLSTETFPSLIRSSGRLTYREVQQSLDHEQKSELSARFRKMLSDMKVVSELLREKRRQAGAILFEMPEVRCILDAAGNVTEIRPRTDFTAYHLIEEFMLLANQAVAYRIASANCPGIWRVHEAPDESQWETMRMELDALGVQDSPSNAHDLNKIAESFSGSSIAHIVNLAMLRNFKRASYSNRRADHFGLAFSHYLHFTSPIRRYPDLITHRILKAIELNRAPPYSLKELARIADQCSRTEREADEAERQSIEIKRISFYDERMKAGDTGPFNAYITGIQGQGLQIELENTLQRGYIPFSYMHSQGRYRGNRKRPGRGKVSRHLLPNMGDPIKVTLENIDHARRRIEFRPA